MRGWSATTCSSVHVVGLIALTQPERTLQYLGIPGDQSRLGRFSNCNVDRVSCPEATSRRDSYSTMRERRVERHQVQSREFFDERHDFFDQCQVTRRPRDSCRTFRQNKNWAEYVYCSFAGLLQEPTISRDNGLCCPCASNKDTGIHGEIHRLYLGQNFQGVLISLQRLTTLSASASHRASHSDGGLEPGQQPGGKQGVLEGTPPEPTRVIVSSQV